MNDQYRLLKNKVVAPVRFFNNLISFIPGGGLMKDLLSFTKPSTAKGKNQNIVSKVLRVAATAAIDRLFLRKAGVVKRLLIGFLSQQAIGKIDKNITNGLIDQISAWIQPSWIQPSKRKSGKSKNPDYDYDVADFGIPPDSETY